MKFLAGSSLSITVEMLAREHLSPMVDNRPYRQACDLGLKRPTFSIARSAECACTSWPRTLRQFVRLRGRRNNLCLAQRLGQFVELPLGATPRFVCPRWLSGGLYRNEGLQGRFF